ncbi:MAG TPA: peptidoglycan DD-metalloendopeptidase family protein, partial [Candidatus Limnocylindria bacterium]|nr:peptidoglycan DD-metalloendopeptidase family protein [Candidatus Limnocylindria bacterium]
SPGQHTFRLRVDRDNSVEESDESESDNEYTRTVTILPGSFRVTAAGGTGGTLAPAGGLTVLDGDTVPFTATPDEGWLVDHWLVDGVPQQTGGNTYTLPAVRADHTVAVTFLIQTYRVILSLPGGGTVSQLPGLDAIPYGTEVSLTATPSPGFRFYDWRGDLSGVGETLRFRITNDVSVEAFFQPVPVASVLRVTDFMRPFGFTIALPQQPEMLHVLQNSSDLAPWSDLTAFDGSVATNFFVFISDTGRRRVFYRCTDVQKITTPPFLTFPLTNRATGHSWTSQSTPVSALFDHYGGANERDGIIATYAGEMVVLGEGNGFRRDGLTTVVPVSPDPGGDYYQKYPVIGIRRDGSQKLPLIFAYDDPDDIFWEDGHPGYDYAVGADEDVVAAAEGDVVPSESTACDGTVCLDHGNGYRTYYRHLSSRSPKLEVNGVIQAIHVKAGELVGHPGSTSCDGPVAVHLHFEVRRNLDNAWLPVDPYGRSCLDGSSIEPSLWLKGN